VRRFSRQWPIFRFGLIVITGIDYRHLGSIFIKPMLPIFGALLHLRPMLNRHEKHRIFTFLSEYATGGFGHLPLPVEKLAGVPVKVHQWSNLQRYQSCWLRQFVGKTFWVVFFSLEIIKLQRTD
jgi:hypothetical protein